MRILYLIHAPFEMPEMIETWALEKGHQQHYVSSFKGEPLPILSSFDCVIAMGGPQSAFDLDADPYLKDEIILLRQAIKTKIPVLGFCLGAQLIGEALGASVERSPFQEIGVYPITLTKEGVHDPLLAHLPKEFPVFHWHSDMPGLTKDAVVLATSAGCPRQIIRYSPLVYAFQCHPEMTFHGAKDLVKKFYNDFTPNKYVQTHQELLSYNHPAVSYANMAHMLDTFFSTVKL